MVETVHDYAAPAHEVWRIAIDWGALPRLNRGMAAMRGLPAGDMQEGQVAEFETSAFGLFPWGAYRVRVAELDHAARRFVTEEMGGAIKTWRHTLTVDETDKGARQTDHIEVGAGWLTPIAALYARVMYTRRDAPRRELLGLEAAT